MSILWSRDRGKSGGQGEHGANHFHSKYILKSNTPTELRTSVLACGLLPVYGSPHPENSLARCVKVDVERHADAPCFWDADCEWNVISCSGRDPSDDQLQPDQRRAKWSSRFTPFPLARFVDWNGKPFQDAAGTPFDPAPDMPIYVDEITVKRYEASCPRGTQRGFMNCANSDEWNGVSSGTALMDDIAVEEEFIQGAYWFMTTYRILINPRVSLTLPLGGTVLMGGWTPEQILNAGPKVLSDDGKPVQPIRPDNQYDGRPVFLTTAGKEIARGSGGVYTADPNFIAFNTKLLFAFAGLDLTPPDGWTM